jgi:hypothetical protein
LRLLLVLLTAYGDKGKNENGIGGFHEVTHWLRERFESGLKEAKVSWFIDHC